MTATMTPEERDLGDRYLSALWAYCETAHSDHFNNPDSLPDYLMLVGQFFEAQENTLFGPSEFAGWDKLPYPPEDDDLFCLATEEALP